MRPLENVQLGLVAAQVEVGRPGEIAAALLGRAGTPEFVLTETTPREIDPDIAAFCKTLDVGPAEFVKVAPMEGATVNGCHHAVARAVAAGLGTAVFGVTVWSTSCGTTSLFLTAESHACLRTPSGTIMDVTPKRDGEATICFAVDARLDVGFDFLRRANNRHSRIYAPTDDGARVRGAIACLHGKDRKYAEGRAAKVGLSLEDWIASRLPPVPLVAAIDAFLACTEKVEALMVPTRSGLVCSDRQSYARLLERQARLYRRMLAAATDLRECACKKP